VKVSTKALKTMLRQIIVDKERHAIIDRLYQLCISLCKEGEVIRESVHSRCCAKEVEIISKFFVTNGADFRPNLLI
jgi:hypothetical protein